MLKYEVRLGKDNFKKNELVWSEKYLSPDLSFVTGVTDTDYHLEKFNKLSATNSIINSDGTLFVETENVQRQGYVVFTKKKYYTNSGETIDYSVNKDGDTISYSYVNINGKYFYWGQIRDTNTSGYTINNLLNHSNGVISDYIEIVCQKSDTGITVDTVYWIEDGKVTIDGDTYIYDNNERNGILKYGENGRALDYTEICESKGYKGYFYNISDYENVTKFKLTKQEEIAKGFEKISFSKYFHYIKYKEHYCQIKRNGTDDNYSFVCEIPKYVLNGGDEKKNLELIEFNVYFTFDNTGLDSYRAAYPANILNSTTYDKHGVKTLDELVNVAAFVYIENDDTFFTVDHDILNANGGNMIAVYLDDEYAPLKVGEKIKFINNSADEHDTFVFNSRDFSGADNDTYITYNNAKYKIIPNLCDKVIINGNEYTIEYNNGKKIDVDCLVTIGDEKVPMKITDASENGGKLKRYGSIVRVGSNSAVTATYDIKSYSGVTINSKNYAILENKNMYGNTEYYATLDLSPQYRFVIDEIVGSSMYVCKLDLSETDFTDDFGRYYSEIVCDDVVNNQSSYELFIQNKIFGENEITSDLPFKTTNKPISSDDFYDLFDDLKIYVDNYYIHIPIELSTNAANNILQEDIVNRDFVEVEKEKAINPIVDMEKDVYIPKSIRGGAYSGSSTIFNSIYEMNFNLHFRTRDLSSWKTNDGYNNYEYASGNTSRGNDNWFITDFYPYRYILDHSGSTSGDTLQQASDLMGMLYFTNDDIFYQRSKVGKSFLRLSFYDSTDPQTQSLLATSCVFVDEHKLYKTFINNSRKNIYYYGSVTEPKYKKNESGFTITPKVDDTTLSKFNKISVNTEFLGETRKKTQYSAISDSTKIVIDESRRISSRLSVTNKYDTETSSEGFYLYIFKDYAENLHPKPIYMKVEFNHAGIGKIIPFLIPMHWSGDTGASNSGKTSYNKMYPDHALKLKDETDFNELLEGIPLSYVYAQTYIPLYAVYDFKNKEYGYVFDSRYVEPDDNGVLNFNLFEMKIKNESDETMLRDSSGNCIDNRVIDIKRNRQIRAIVNVNKKQFNKKYFNEERE